MCAKYQISDRYFNRKGYELTMFSQWATHASAAILGVCRQFSVVRARTEKRRRIRRQESDGDGGAGEKKERKAKEEMDG